MSRPCRVLMVYPRFVAETFWNFADACKLMGARYPASLLGLITVAAMLPEKPIVSAGPPETPREPAREIYRKLDDGPRRDAKKFYEVARASRDWNARIADSEVGAYRNYSPPASVPGKCASFRRAPSSVTANLCPPMGESVIGVSLEIPKFAV